MAAFMVDPAAAAIAALAALDNVASMEAEEANSGVGVLTGDAVDGCLPGCFPNTGDDLNLNTVCRGPFALASGATPHGSPPPAITPAFAFASICLDLLLFSLLTILFII